MNALVPVNTSNAEVYRASTDAAGLCKDIVMKTAQQIGGRKYVKVEGWQAIAIAHGCVASSDNVERVDDDAMGGFKAIGIVRRMSDGAEIARAEGFLGDDEKVWANRPVYARRAMVQTRAISRACRSAFAHVVVLIDANLSTTPAEEVPEGGFDDRPAPRNVTPPAQHAPKAEAAKEGPKTDAPKFVDWRTLDDEMDACRGVDELEAWNHRRELHIKALPKPKFDTLAAKFGDLREKLPDVAPKAAATAAPTETFDIDPSEIPF